NRAMSFAKVDPTEIGPFNLHGVIEFAPFRDILHSRMRELEEIHNGTYQGADPLNDNEIEQIFGHHKLDRDTPFGLLRRVFLWIGCCAAKRSGYYDSNTSGSGHNTPSQIYHQMN
ncbi:12032_t:CDS:2, partial [Gigaspora rosea]